MKRSLLAWVALLTLAAGLADAHYLIIKVNMGLRPPEKVDPDRPEPPPEEKPKPMQEEKPVTVVVFLEFTGYKPVPSNPNLFIPKGVVINQVFHKWGHSFIMSDDKHIKVMPPIVRKTVAQRYEEKRSDISKTKDKEKAPAKLKEVADFALTNGLLPQFLATMDELSKLDPKEPEIVSVLKAFQQVRENLKKPVLRDDPAIAWKNQLEVREDRSEHYILLFDSKAPSANVEARNRLQRLERNLEAFYYWFAMQGKVLPMPERRLVGVLLEKPADFAILHRHLDAVPLVADGFFARRDNLVVFSTDRLDGPSEPIYRRCTEFMQAGWNFKEIMNPKFVPTGRAPLETAYVHTLALVKKCLDEESENATVSHQGTRQLLAALGLLPRAVELPEWIQFGFPSFFETPKFDPYTHTGAFWTGTGAPSWTYLVQWQVWDKEKQLDPPEEAIRKVVSDGYFRQSKGGKDEEALQKARTMAWAFTYYLAHRHLDKLLSYGQELNRLPRDLEFDGDVHLACFARAFDLADPNQPDGINNAKLEEMARDWYKFLGLVPLPMPELFQEAHKTWKERQAKMRPPLGN